MQLTIITTSGKLSIGEFADDSILELTETLQSGDDAGFLLFQMDEAMVYVNPAHIVRVDIEP